MALIDIGSQKQLFVDDYLIESMTLTKRVMNPAEKVENNPVLRAERPWEGDEVRLSYVTFDERDQEFKMRYRGGTHTVQQGDGEVIIEERNAVNCLAVSKDGVHWERPVVGEVEFQGSKENNIVPERAGLPNAEHKPPHILEDLHETDPAKRYKALRWTMDTRAPMQAFLYTSPDAWNWTPYENNPLFDTTPKIGRWGPSHLMGWDPIRETYAITIENSHHRRGPMGKRLIGRSESPDMIEWSEPETILVPDEQDAPDIEFYSMPTIVYENMYVGLVWIFSTTNTTHHPELVFSRDGVHYERRYRAPFIRRGSGIEFDSTSIYAYPPIVHGDRILTYYVGTNWRSPEQLLALGKKGTAAVGLAVTRLDGLVSLDGTKGRPVDVPTPNPRFRDAPPPRVADFSEMVTRSFGFSGSQLHLNLRPAFQQWGASPCEVRVEVLEPNNDYIDGYRFDDADPISGPDSLDHVVSWRRKSDLSNLAGKTIKLRFYFKNCKLYSFQFK